jgi:RHS repeat-associated protein
MGCVRLMGNKVNVTGSYTETNLWSISVEANDCGSPVDATFRDGGNAERCLGRSEASSCKSRRGAATIARGVSLNDDDDNTLEATITDLGGNSSTYPVSPATYPLKLDRNLNVTYNYDAAGNITKKTQVVDYDEGGGDTYITRYFYDDANRLEYIDYDWTTTEDVHYVYGPTGQRVEIEYGQLTLSGDDFSSFSASTSRGFVCMGGNVLEEWTVSGGSLDSLVYRYVRNPATNLGGGIGSIAYQIDGSDYRYYHYNHKGDTGALTDEDGDIVAWYEYDAWGNVVTEWEASGVENEFRFSTKQWDAVPTDANGDAPPDTGLIYFGARYLSPELGRWTQIDPFDPFILEAGFDSSGRRPCSRAGSGSSLMPGEDSHLTTGRPYVYVRNSPLQFIDPDGRVTTLVELLGGGLHVAHAVHVIHVSLEAYNVAHQILSHYAGCVECIANAEGQSAGLYIGTGQKFDPDSDECQEDVEWVLCYTDGGGGIWLVGQLEEEDGEVDADVFKCQ